MHIILAHFGVFMSSVYPSTRAFAIKAIIANVIKTPRYNPIILVFSSFPFHQHLYQPLLLSKQFLQVLYPLLKQSRFSTSYYMVIVVPINCNRAVTGC